MEPAAKPVEDNQLLEVKRTRFSMKLDAVAQMYHEQEGILLHVQRRDGVHWIRNVSRATGLTVQEHPSHRVTGWLTNSRYIADELEKFQCENRTQPTYHRQDELVLAILKGLGTQLQVYGKMEVCSIGPHFTGHDDEPIDEGEITKFYDDVTGELLPRHLV